MPFTLTSPALEADQRINQDHTCDGSDRPPTLEWSGVPEGTRSLALIMDDPDAPNGTFTHWVVWNMPAIRDTEDPVQPAELGVAGKNDFHGVGYGGPCPPPNHDPHRYRLRLLALDVDGLELPPGADRRALEAAVQGHVVGEADLVGRYGRKTG